MNKILITLYIIVLTLAGWNIREFFVRTEMRDRQYSDHKAIERIERWAEMKAEYYDKE